MANSTGFALTGSVELKGKLKKLGSSSPLVAQIGAKSLYESCEMVMTESKDIYCPVATGALRSTGTVQLPTIDGGKISVVMSYGGPTAPYAIFVHETNKNYRNSKQWKYLETPLLLSEQKIEDKLAADYIDGLGNL